MSKNIMQRLCFCVYITKMQKQRKYNLFTSFIEITTQREKIIFSITYDII